MYEDTSDGADNAIDQLKRADHLLHVTLKYSRTGDVMKNIIKRLIGSMDNGLDEALEEAKNRKTIKEVPKKFSDKLKIIQKIFPKDQNVKEYVVLHNQLKILDKAHYTVKEEYRKNITLITDVGNINTDKLMDFYLKVKDMVIHLEKWKRKL